MPKFSDYPSTARIKLLLLGDPKVGKTGQLATLANEGYNLRIVDLDNNLAILNSYLTEEGRSRVSFISIPTKEKASWDKAKRALRRWDDNTDVASWGLDTVLVIDSASFLGEAALKAREGESKDPRQDYYASQNDFINEIARITGPALKCHLVLIAHFKTYMSKVDEVYRNIPAFAGPAISLEVPKYCNNVWAIIVKSGDRRIIRTQSSTDYPFLGSSAPNKLTPDEEFNLGKLFRKATS